MPIEQIETYESAEDQHIPSTLPPELHCSACGSYQVRALGFLDSQLWLRCRACGIDVKTPANSEPTT